MIKKINQLSIVYFVMVSCASNAQKIVESSENEYYKADKKIDLTEDKSIILTEDEFYLTEDCVYYNSYSDENNFQYNYLGSFGSNLEYVIVEKIDYNSSDFFVVEKKDCRKKELFGYPYFFNDYLITVNKSSVTDYESYITIFELKSELKLIKKIKLPENIIVKEVKMKNKKIFLLDIHESFFKLNL